MLVRVFHVSAVVEPISAVDIQVMLGAAQMRNRRLDVTGWLAQVLEGRREAVQQVLKRVARDVRHRDVRIIPDEELLQRQFPR